MIFLGLDDDEEIEEYDVYDEAAVAPQPPRRYVPDPVDPPRDLDRPVMAGRSMSRDAAKEPSGAVRVAAAPAPVRPINAVPSVRVQVVVPLRFADCEEIGRHCKQNAAVLVNLQEVDAPLTRRIVDFISGLTYGLSGSMEKVGDQVFLLTPADLEVSVEERRRLEEAGFSAS
jgi:cell division inhibitor SepF